jgi:hypothetical protein
MQLSFQADHKALLNVRQDVLPDASFTREEINQGQCRCLVAKGLEWAQCCFKAGHLDKVDLQVSVAVEGGSGKDALEDTKRGWSPSLQLFA